MTAAPATEVSPWFRRTRELALTLTGWPSVTGSPGETAFAGRLQGLLRGWEAFSRCPEDVWLTPARAGYDAHNVYALVRGSSPWTVLLSGHYDTVGTEDYGPWQALAHDPEVLGEAVRAALAGAGPHLSSGERLAAQDLASGDYLMGRGLLDMKGGLAAGLAVLERYAALPLEERPGHLLLVASPDEEGRSSGARAVAHDLPLVAREHNLELVAGLNLDATADLGDGHDGRAVYLGTVGKVLISALVVGRPAHAAYPFSGVSAALLAASLVARVEAASDLADGAANGFTGERAAPPVCLELRDGKSGYDVTSPAWVWCAFNVLTQTRTPSQVLAGALRLARQVANGALGTFAARAQASGNLNAQALRTLRAEVLSFGDLRDRARARSGEAAVGELLNVPAGNDPLRVNREITAALVALAGLEGPAIVVGFGALHYPHTQLGEAPADQRLFQAVSQHAAQLASERGESLRLRRYFAGISDMSFLGQRASEQEGAALARHTPHPGYVDPLPPRALVFPVVNIGPWGRDYHQRLERIHAPYAFDAVPELLWRVSRSVLEKP